MQCICRPLNSRNLFVFGFEVEKPIVVRRSDEEFAQIGHGASLRCSASGRPVPVFHWTVDDALVVNGSNVKVGSYVTTAGDVISHVNISSVSLEDGGSYRCTALNKAGTDFRETRFNVYGTTRSLRRINYPKSFFFIV